LAIDSQSLLAINVGKSSSVSGGTGTITNDGTIRIGTGASPAAGATFTPISAGTWSGSGTYQALGGTWNSTSHVFTASAVQEGTSGSPVTIDLSSNQRVLISDSGDSGTGWSVGASFLAAASPKSLSITASAMGDDTLLSLKDLLEPDLSVLGGWQFAADSGYTTGDPAYLSFNVGAGYNRNGLEVWHYDGTNWTPYAANDLTYDGTYASFTVTSFSGYAVTTPEPGTLALLATGLLGMLIYARRTRKG
jgi:hypothetical protein